MFIMCWSYWTNTTSKWMTKSQTWMTSQPLYIVQVACLTEVIMLICSMFTCQKYYFINFPASSFILSSSSVLVIICLQEFSSSTPSSQLLSSLISDQKQNQPSDHPLHKDRHRRYCHRCHRHCCSYPKYLSLQWFMQSSLEMSMPKEVGIRNS